MKVILEKKKLLEALDKVRWTVSNSEMIQILRCFCFKEGRVHSSNGSAGTVTKCDIGGGQFCVLADKFYRIIQGMYETVEIEHVEGFLNIKSGGNKTTLGTYPITGFPDLIPEDYQVFCRAPNFCESLTKLDFTMGTNAMKPMLLGIGVRGNYAYSGDGQRISRQRLTDPADGFLTIPSQSVGHMVRLGQPDYVFRNRTLVGGLFSKSGTIYAANCVATDFPFDLADTVFTKIKENIWTDFPEELPDAVKRVQLLAANEETSIIVSCSGEGILHLESKSEVGSASDDLTWACEHKFRFAVRPDWLLKAFERSRRVDIGNVVSGQNTQLVFEDELGFQHILALMVLID